MAGAWSAWARAAASFPRLSVAARIDRDVEGGIQFVDVVVSALGARPPRVRAAAKITAGTAVSGLADALAQGACSECTPLTNLDEEAAYRREMVPVLVKKAVARALG